MAGSPLFAGPRLFLWLLLALPAIAPGCVQAFSKVAALPVPDGLSAHEGERITLHTNLTPTESAAVVSFVQEVCREYDLLFGSPLNADLDVYVYRGEEWTSRGRSLPSGIVQVDPCWILQKHAPPFGIEALRAGALGDLLRHEVSHQYLFRAVGRLPRHPWLIEGLPELLMSMEADGAGGRFRVRRLSDDLLRVAAGVEEGLSLLPEHVVDMGWQEFYRQGWDAYPLAATVVDLLHEEAGRPADLAAFCRELVSRRNAGTLLDSGFTDRWRRHVREARVRQATGFQEWFARSSPADRLAAIEDLAHDPQVDARWGKGGAVLLDALLNFLAVENEAVRRRALPIALACFTHSHCRRHGEFRQLRLPIARCIARDHAVIPLPRLAEHVTQFGGMMKEEWDLETLETFVWTLERIATWNTADEDDRASLGRMAAVVLPAFGEAGAVAHLALLGRLFEVESPDIVRRAMDTTARISPSAARGMLEPLLASPDPRRCEAAALAFSRVDFARATPLLQGIAANRESPRRADAIHLLTDAKDPAEVEFLRRLADDDESGTLEESGYWHALATLGSPEALAVLDGLFGDTARRDRLVRELARADSPTTQEFLAARLPRIEDPPIGLLEDADDRLLQPHGELLGTLFGRWVEADRTADASRLLMRMEELGKADLVELDAVFRLLGRIETAHREVARKAARCDPGRTLEILIRRLSGGDDERETAMRLLHALTGEAHGFHWAAPRHHRERSAAAWSEWLATSRDRLAWDSSKQKIVVSGPGK